MIFLQLRLVSLNSTQKLDAAKGEQKKVKKWTRYMAAEKKSQSLEWTIWT